MRIKSRYELNFIQIATLAICPLIFTQFEFMSALTILILSLVSYFISFSVCLIFRRGLNKNLKVFIVALISSLTTIVYGYLVSKSMLHSVKNNDYIYVCILMTMILSIDFIYVNKEASLGVNILRFLRISVIYSFFLVAYIEVKEFLSLGTVGGMKLLKFSGIEFFKLPIIDFIFLGLICAFFDLAISFFVNVYNDRKIGYNKYRNKIQNEKKFLYEHYRRKKLLTSPIEINKIKINSKDNTDEDDEDSENLDKNDDSENSSDDKNGEKTIIKPRIRKKFKGKISKEAKIERVFERKSGSQGGEK